MGRLNHENSVAIPGYGKPVVLTGDDSFVSNPAQSQLYSYIADNGDAVWNDEGDLYGVRRRRTRRRRLLRLPDRLADERDSGTLREGAEGHRHRHAPDGSELMAADKGYPAPPNNGTWQRDPNDVGIDGPQWVLEHWGDTLTKPVFQFTRVEDIAYDRRPGMQNVVYVVDSGRGRHRRPTATRSRRRTAASGSSCSTRATRPRCCPSRS